MPDPQITASDLYNYTKCHHKVYLDANGNPAEKGEVSSFARLLWEMGLQTERDYLGRFGGVEVTDLSRKTPEAAWVGTAEAMRQGDALIYQGCLIHGRYRGRPDLLIRSDDAPSAWGDYHYEPVDIKAGRGWEERDGKVTGFKQHYAFQLLFYRDLLQAIQGYVPPKARIINVDQEIEEFDPAVFEATYRAAKAHVERLIAGEEASEPVLGSQCTQCEWFQRCYDWVEREQDPTRVFFVGKTKFGLKQAGVRTVADLARIDIDKHLEPPHKIPRMGRASLERARRRAGVVLRGEPEIRPGYAFPEASTEVYFDIEDDPTRAVTYLYGLLEVGRGEAPRFRYLLAEHPNEEERAVREFWDYLGRMEGAVYYVYSPKERTTLRRLMEKYGLDREVYERYVRAEYDLYQKLVVDYSDWPTFSYGIKQIAKQIGFSWRDPDPSGVNSIVWYNDFLSDPTRREVMRRILEYNEDDCRAMVAVKRYFVDRMNR
ncbi:MAG: TM0106 family RecB-like putative nuclease [Nitrospirota bacterium]